MNRFVLAAAALILSSGAVLASEILAPLYGNTLTITDSKGGKQIIYVNADKTWESHPPDGTVYKGTWAMRDASHACFTLTDPPPGPDDKPDCPDVTGMQPVGTAWEDGDGENKSSLIITAGR